VSVTDWAVALARSRCSGRRPAQATSHGGAYCFLYTNSVLLMKSRKGLPRGQGADSNGEPFLELFHTIFK
jgi:hypothetical protein